MAAIGLVSCAEEFAPVEVPVEKPASMVEYEYLNGYEPLKNYINTSTDPNFKLGVGIDPLTNFTDRRLGYVLATSNFNEIVATKAMNHAAIIANDGTMNLLNPVRFMSAAKASGMSVYGHALVWHDQQNTRWLNKLIQYPQDPTWAVVSEQDFETDDLSNYPYNAGAVVSFVDGANGEGRALKITNESVKTNSWDCQSAILFPLAEGGVTYKLKMWIRADQEVTSGSQYHGPAFSNYITNGPGVAFKTQWTYYEREFTAPVHSNGSVAIAVTFEMGSVATSYYFDNIVIERFYPDGVGGGGGGAGDGGHAMKLSNDQEKTNPWDIQIAYDFPQALEPGVKYTLNFMAKADRAVNLPFVIQTASYSGQLNGQASIGETWTEHNLTFTPSVEGDIQFRINMGKVLATIFIDNLTFIAEGSTTSLIPNGDFESDIQGIWGGWGWTGNIPVQSWSEDGDGYVSSSSAYRPLAEQKEILTAEMDRWISTMMDITGAITETGISSDVKAWDLIKEPMDDDNPSALRTNDADGDGQPDDPASLYFFWQDGMGQDYARIAAKLARQYGGNDLKLFVNESNLETNSAKVDGLIDMIEYWESDNVTKIDGIGTQMHVTYNMDAAKQTALENGIVTMLQKLAATGKLIKISELDMGIVDASGAAIPVVNVTIDQHKAMGEFYRFIVSKYFELIPAAQRYGITQWSAADNGGTGGWRPNQPIGLWFTDYNRKPAYAGFANGLAGE